MEQEAIHVAIASWINTTPSQLTLETPGHGGDQKDLLEHSPS